MEIDICQQQNRWPKVWDDTSLKPVVTHKLPFPARAEVEGKATRERNTLVVNEFILFILFYQRNEQKQIFWDCFLREREETLCRQLSWRPSCCFADQTVSAVKTTQGSPTTQRLSLAHKLLRWPTTGEGIVARAAGILSQTLALMSCAWKHAN